MCSVSASSGMTVDAAGSSSCKVDDSSSIGNGEGSSSSASDDGTGSSGGGSYKSSVSSKDMVGSSLSSGTVYVDSAEDAEEYAGADDSESSASVERWSGPSD